VKRLLSVLFIPYSLIRQAELQAEYQRQRAQAAEEHAARVSEVLAGVRGKLMLAILHVESLQRQLAGSEVEH
jgi:hypothetical protein